MTVAEERIDRLHDLARAAAADGEDDRARYYVRLARRVAERNRLPLPREFRRFTCDDCDTYLRPGKNARVRLQNGHVVISCDCGAHARYPYGDQEDDGDQKDADESGTETESAANSR